MLVRNPMNLRQIRAVDLSPEAVDGIVFWTKNPLPMLDRLDILRDYDYYFQFTLTCYGADVEARVPPKLDVLVPAFRRLSELIGPERVVWRYDPILLGGCYTAEHHAAYFEKLAGLLEGYTNACVISFLDRYRHIEKRLRALGVSEIGDEDAVALAASLAGSARRHGLTLSTCAERLDLERYGISHGRCVDAALLGALRGACLSGHSVRQIGRPAKSQRPECLCHEAVDIGAYGTCRGGCVYCYANRSAAGNAVTVDTRSPVLGGAAVSSNPTEKSKSGSVPNG